MNKLLKIYNNNVIFYWKQINIIKGKINNYKQK